MAESYPLDTLYFYLTAGCNGRAVLAEIASGTKSALKRTAPRGVNPL